MQQQAKHLQIKTRKLMNSLFIGNFKSAFHGRWIEFQDFREYAPWDDAKYIDWVISGREGKTIMRRYREDKEGTILCIVDESASLNQRWGAKYAVVQEILMFLWQASLLAGESFWGYRILEWTQEYIKAKKSQVSLQSFLVKKEFHNSQDPITLDFLLKSPLKRSIVFVISDRIEVDESSFRIAAIKHDLIYLHVSDHFENTLEWQWVERVRGIWGAFWINLDDSEKKKLYQKKRREKLGRFAKKLRSLGCEVAFFDNNTSIFWELLALMKRREK